MNHMKRILAVIMAFAMMLAVVPAFALGGTKVSGALSESEREAKLASLMSFTDRLVEMKKAAGTNYATKDASDPFATARIIVKYAGTLDYSGSVDHVSGHNDWHVIQYATRDEAEAAAKKYSEMKGVEYAVPDRIVKMDAAPGVNSFKSWGYGQDHVDAFNYNEWLYAETGSDLNNLPEIVVAVIDTGTDASHPFLAGRVLTNGYDFIDNDSNPNDEHYHGTHVSGTVVDGTFSNVKIMPVRVLDATGYGDDTGVASGIEYAYLNGADVENMSLGGDCDYNDENVFHPMFVEVIDAAFDNGTTVCVAAGNESENAMEHCPANVPRAFTVASITSSHYLSWFSNYGDIVDIAAPGSGINSCVPGGGYDSLDGTSMATPHVAAACAMVKSYFPDMDADDVVTTLKGAAVDIGVDGIGAGMLNVTDLFKFDDHINFEGQYNHFTSNGSYVWNVEDGAAVSGNAGHNNSSSVLTTKLGLKPYQLVTFDVKISSEENRDKLYLKANGSVIWEISGEHDWQTVTAEIPVSGWTTVTWEYVKDGSGAAGEDKAWVDNIGFELSLSSVTNSDGCAQYFTSEGDNAWSIDMDEYAAVSGTNGVSSMFTTIQLVEGMRLGFDYKVASSAKGTFKVFIDGAQVLDSGNTGWHSFEYFAPTSKTAVIEFRSTGAAAWVKDFVIGHTFQSAACASGSMLDLHNDSEYPWEVVDSYIRSTNHMASSNSLVLLTLSMEAGQTLTFRYKVSSENNYDWFNFYADNTQLVHASGEHGWTEYTFTANQTKSYSFKWEYTKDWSVSSGDDSAYIDDISWSGSPAAIAEGDADMNGTVDSADALLILRYALDMIDAGDICLSACDMDGNGTVDSADALIVLRMAMNAV